LHQKRENSATNHLKDLQLTNENCIIERRNLLQKLLWICVKKETNLLPNIVRICTSLEKICITIIRKLLQYGSASKGGKSAKKTRFAQHGRKLHHTNNIFATIYLGFRYRPLSMASRARRSPRRRVTEMEQQIAREKTSGTWQQHPGKRLRRLVPAAERRSSSVHGGARGGVDYGEERRRKKWTKKAEVEAREHHHRSMGRESISSLKAKGIHLVVEKMKIGTSPWRYGGPTGTRVARARRTSGTMI
jgi:hypothetical protein